jgi:hypothetical protein
MDLGCVGQIFVPRGSDGLLGFAFKKNANIPGDPYVIFTINPEVIPFQKKSYSFPPHVNPTKPREWGIGQYDHAYPNYRFAGGTIKARGSSIGR